MKKKMTIEDLARITAKGFEGVDRHLAEIEKRLGGVEGRLEETATKKDIAEMATKKDIAGLHYDISVVQSMPARLDRRVDLLEDDMRLVKTKVGMK